MPLAVEVAVLTPGNEAVARCYLSNESELEDIARRFLCQGVEIVHMSEYEWKDDGLDHDKFIPHPPNQAIPGNIADVFDSRWIGDDPNSQPQRATQSVRSWWKFW